MKYVHELPWSSSFPMNAGGNGGGCDGDGSCGNGQSGPGGTGCGH